MKATSEAFGPFSSTAWPLLCALQPPPSRSLFLKTVSTHVLGIRVAAAGSAQSGADPACRVACARGGVTVDTRRVTLTERIKLPMAKSIKMPGPRAGASGKDGTGNAGSGVCHSGSCPGLAETILCLSQACGKQGQPRDTGTSCGLKTLLRECVVYVKIQLLWVFGLCPMCL